MIARKVGPALAAGCTMVCKPATATPYSALGMAGLAARAGVPAGVLSVVTGFSGVIGGNAPFIVFNDAYLVSAVEGAMASRYRNAGQTCVCTNRMLGRDSVYDEFAAKLSQTVRGLLVGNGMDAGVSQGPLIDFAAVEKVESHIADAVSKGARVVVGEIMTASVLDARGNVINLIYNPEFKVP